MVTSLGVKPFDIAEHLDSEEVIAEYLTSILADGDQDELFDAISQVERARGMADLARDAGLGRESLCNALKSGAQPRFHTVVKVLHALGVGLWAVPAARAHSYERAGPGPVTRSPVTAIQGSANQTSR